MSLTNPPQVLLFDVFGTVVEWRTSVTNALRSALSTNPSTPADIDYLSLAEEWRKSYSHFTRTFDPTTQPFVSVDEHHYTSLTAILARRFPDLAATLSDAQRRDLATCWHRLEPWADSARGLHDLNSRFRTATLSNGNVDLLRDLAAYGALPFVEIVSAEHFGAYKPAPAVYRGAAARFGVEPGQCAMVAAHLHDLKAAKACGLQTIYVARPLEENGDEEAARAEGFVDMWVDDDAADKDQIYRHADADGHFRRKDSVFRSFVSPDADAEFPAERDRYVLYLAYGCPWAHRTNIVRTLKGLDDIIQLVVLDPELGPDGWFFSGRWGSAERDPLYGFGLLRELYFKADPNYTGRYTIPVLWDKKRETIVSNESSEIIRMFYTAFDALLPPACRESHHPAGGLYPAHLRGEIDAMNEWVYDKINNGVYKTGFATTQEAYDANVYPLFEALDRVEDHLAQPGHQPYLFGEHITEADVRLYTTICRFDVAYYLIFRCNLKMIRHDYPRIDSWYRRLYYDESERTRGGAFKNTTFFWIVSDVAVNADRADLGSINITT
ncbi:hypothetical protein ATEG_06899 [Aspergillus terreus NIH2624]|uniref:GST C-terminal domain-containing protein n=1 Tax=Aspergillus terreus (strain NIH 2624 / FGSC A1156) TaxID=341663 RepID=Q0CHE3_ASPTN|nr:uncharacterized protein ATEG_06899 [Aspergillus terreus NIH2624]EAU32283.1 hypothetical protein ATEG_06899 [Aspergillus terreus NIH2624]